MLKFIRNFYAPAAHQPVLDDESTVKKKMFKYRYSVFLSATMGYALFYVCRLSLSVVKKPLVDANILTETELGQIGAALFFTYAVGKLINGIFSDSTNINRFIATGLLISALINLALGAFPIFIVFVILWGINGWFQSLGAAPSVVALTRWFSPEVRGTYYGIWSSSHNIGKAITFTLLPFLIGIGGWQWGFWGAGVAGVLGAIMVLIFLHDSPESKGLPSVVSKSEEFKVTEKKAESVGAAQRAIVKNPYIWLIALSSALMYISRYAIESWGIFYAQAEKGYALSQAGQMIGLTAITGIVGTAISGLISDKFFRGSRNIPALIAGLLNILSVSVFLFYPNGNVWIDSAAMLVHGFAIGILITFLGGLMAIDIVPKQATGATMGLIGIASYVGAGLQELISGFLISDKKVIVDEIISYDFSIARFFWFGATVLSALVALLVWNAKKKKLVL